jgi:hypothetical protein
MQNTQFLCSEMKRSRERDERLHVGNPASTTNPTQTAKPGVAQVEAVPPCGRLGFDPDHIVVHHLQLNQNVESRKSPDQM